MAHYRAWTQAIAEAAEEYVQRRQGEPRRKVESLHQLSRDDRAYLESIDRACRDDAEPRRFSGFGDVPSFARSPHDEA